MPEQYVASDKRTGVEVQVTGDFPPHPDDRMRIARTTTLFTRLFSTILATENESQRRQGFQAVETQLELAEALIREDAAEVQRLLRATMEKMGITEAQLEEMARKLMQQLGENDFEFPAMDDDDERRCIEQTARHHAGVSRRHRPQRPSRP